jgi:hypothetical protein
MAPMRLADAKIPEVAARIVSVLVTDGDIETDTPKEVELDVLAVLNQYVKDEQEINDRAKDLMASRGLPPTELGRMRRLVAEQRQFKLGDDAVDYLLDQLVEMLMHSGNVEEIYAEDVELRRKMRGPLREQLAAEDELQAEVRSRLRHVQEGTSLWEIEYQRMVEDIRRRKGS